MRHEPSHLAATKSIIIALALACIPMRSTAAGTPASSDRANLQGVWLAQSESQNGQTRNVTYQYVFRGNRLTFKDENGQEVKYSFRLEAAGGLKFIAIRPEEAPAYSSPVSVAYVLDGDSLKIVVAPPGLRPTEISDRNDQELIVCKRKKP